MDGNPTRPEIVHELACKDPRPKDNDLRILPQSLIECTNMPPSVHKCRTHQPHTRIPFRYGMLLAKRRAFEILPEVAVGRTADIVERLRLIRIVHGNHGILHRRAFLVEEQSVHPEEVLAMRGQELCLCVKEMVKEHLVHALDIGILPYKCLCLYKQIACAPDLGKVHNNHAAVDAHVDGVHLLVGVELAVQRKGVRVLYACNRISLHRDVPEFAHIPLHDDIEVEEDHLLHIRKDLREVKFVQNDGRPCVNVGEFHERCVNMHLMPAKDSAIAFHHRRQPHTVVIRTRSDEKDMDRHICRRILQNGGAEHRQIGIVLCADLRKVDGCRYVDHRRTPPSNISSCKILSSAISTALTLPRSSSIRAGGIPVPGRLHVSMSARMLVPAGI